MEKTAAIPGLQDEFTLALSKAVKEKMEKTARGNVGPGTYDVDFKVGIKGSVTVGHDYQTTVPNKAKPWNLVVALMTEVERLRAAAGEAGINLDKIMAMAEALDPNLVKEAQEKAEKAAASLKDATLTAAKGKVTTNLVITPL